MAATQNINLLIGNTLSEIRFLVCSHVMQTHLPPSFFSMILSDSLPAETQLTSSQQEAFRKTREIMAISKKQLTETEYNEFYSTMLDIVETADRMIYRPAPTYERLIQSYTAHELLQNGNEKLLNMIKMSPEQLSCLDKLDYKIKQMLKTNQITIEEALRLQKKYDETPRNERVYFFQNIKEKK